jgi:hypothetical protein
MDGMRATGSTGFPRTQARAPELAGADPGYEAIGSNIAAEQVLTERFPDLQMQMDNPSLERVRHDVYARDPSLRYTCDELFDLLIAGPGSMDPDQEVEADEFDAVAGHLEDVLIEAYEGSPTFRRLFNHAANTHLRDTRWYLAPSEAFGTTVTPQQREAAGNRMVIALNCDLLELGGDDDYACASGRHPFSVTRSYVHEVVHALTGLTDVEEGHPRGAVVEYENLIMKEIGEDSPARTHYESVLPPQPGVEAIDLSSIDFAAALGAPFSPASVPGTSSSSAPVLSASPPP